MSTFADDLFQFVRDMNRGYAAALRDSAARVAPPDEGSRPFGELLQEQQLDILATLSGRSSHWMDIMIEALSESAPQIVRAVLNSSSTDERITRLLREVLIEYAARVAAERGDDLTEIF